MNQEETVALLAYLITSAANLSEEPAYYGPLRLIEAASRLIALMGETGENPALAELKALIDADKHKGMTAPAEFQSMLDRAAEKLADCL